MLTSLMKRQYLEAYGQVLFTFNVSLPLDVRVPIRVVYRLRKPIVQCWLHAVSVSLTTAV